MIFEHAPSDFSIHFVISLLIREVYIYKIFPYQLLTKKFIRFFSMANFISHGQNLNPDDIVDMELGKVIFITFVFHVKHLTKV